MGQSLYPVLMAVPARIRCLKGPDRGRALSSHARKCLVWSARKAGLPAGSWQKDGRGCPVACKGVHWSLSHKPGMVCGIVAPMATGIDIEMTKPVSDALFHRIVTPAEAACFPGALTRAQIFFRAFTAKEAVLKCRKTGLKELSQVQVIRFCPPGRMQLRIREMEYGVENYAVNGYLASIVTDDVSVKWSVIS